MHSPVDRPETNRPILNVPKFRRETLSSTPFPDLSSPPVYSFPHSRAPLEISATFCTNRSEAKMALLFGVNASFLPGEMTSFVKSFPAPTVKLVPANLRGLRRMTVSAASKPATTDTTNRKPRGIMTPRRVSPEMQAFCGGVSEIPRTQALKEIWAHIKQHNLQDPADKKVIICDEKLKTIFGGRDRVGFLEIAGLISPHFLK